MATDVKISSVLQALQVYRANPAMMIKTFFNALEKASDITIVDATSPIAWLTEQGVLTTVTAIDSYNSVLRKMSPIHAMNFEDIYPHLNDNDYKYIYAKPSQVTIYLILSKSEVISKMKNIPGTEKYKLTIPANSEFTISSYTLSMQYPIDIILNNTGSLTISYNNPAVAATETIASSDISWEQFRATDGIEYIKIPIKVWQFRVIEKQILISASSGNRSDINLSNYLYQCRVYKYTQSSQSYDEIATTGSVYHYSPDTPTAIVQYINNKVKVSIPTNYVVNGQLQQKVRLLVYDTMGDVTPSLSSFRPTEWAYAWKTLDPNGFTTYEAGINLLNTIIVYSDDVLSGGATPLTFDELKKQIINRSIGGEDGPITHAQLTYELNRLGFDLVKDIDTITNRNYHAIRKMPAAPDNLKKYITFNASASTSMVPISFSQANTLSGVHVDSASSITISPKTLFEYSNGGYVIVSKDELDFINSLSTKNLVSYINQRKYTFTPFDYVIDSSSGTTSVKCYYLNDPSIKTKSFVDTNDLSNLSITTSSNYYIERLDSGYRLHLYTKSNQDGLNISDDDLSVTISFIDPYNSKKCFYHGVLLSKTTDGERHYYFDINTKFYINSTNNYIKFNSAIVEGVATDVRSTLTTDINIIYSVKGTNAPPRSEFESEIDQYTLGLGYYGLNYETMSISFGSPVANLWNRHRVATTDTQYLKYSTDIYQTYDRNVYQIINGLPFTIDGAGIVWNNILHHAGDYVLTNSGQKVVKHLAGENILDAMGTPQIDPNYYASLIHQIDIFMLDGQFMFVTDTNCLEYLKYIKQNILNWTNDDLAEINLKTLDQTNIYFNPKKEHGNLIAYNQLGQATNILAQQSFTVNIYVLNEQLLNDDIKDKISTTVVEVIKNNIDTDVISISLLNQKIKSSLPENVIDVSISNIDGTHTFLSMSNSTDRICLNKKLKTITGGKISMIDSVDIVFNSIIKK